MTLPHGDSLMREWLEEFAPAPETELEMACVVAQARVAQAATRDALSRALSTLSDLIAQERLLAATAKGLDLINGRRS